MFFYNTKREAIEAIDSLNAKRAQYPHYCAHGEYAAPDYLPRRTKRDGKIIWGIWVVPCYYSGTFNVPSSCWLEEWIDNV